MLPGSVSLLVKYRVSFEDDLFRANQECDLDLDFGDVRLPLGMRRFQFVGSAQ
jgi:hypothetical protein